MTDMTLYRTIENLRYIVSSPPHEVGGFRPEVKAAAEFALAEIERLRAENERLTARLSEYRRKEVMGGGE